MNNKKRVSKEDKLIYKIVAGALLSLTYGMLFAYGIFQYCMR